MENKFQSILGGRVGDVRSPYRDHNVSELILVMCGLDTSREKRAGLLDQRELS